MMVCLLGTLLLSWLKQYASQVASHVKPVVTPAASETGAGHVEMPLTCQIQYQINLLIAQTVKPEALPEVL